MGKTLYTVPMVKRGARVAPDADKHIEFVEAGNKQDAASKAEKQKPGWVAILSDIGRH